MGVGDAPRGGETRSVGALFRDLAVSSAELLRGELRVARMEAGEVGTRVARNRLDAIHLLENVRWQAANAVKFFHHFKLLDGAPPRGPTAGMA